MATTTEPRADQPGRSTPPSQAVAGRVVARALALAVDPLVPVGRAVSELRAIAGHDRAILGDAWVEVALASLIAPSRALVNAERLLSSALEHEASRQHHELLAG